MNAFTNQTIDLLSIPQFQEVPLTKINPNYKKVVIYNYVTIILAMLVASIALYFADVFITKPFFIISVSVISTTILFGIFNTYIIKYRSYAFREHDIISQQGFIYKNLNIVPNNRIQHISINQGVFSKKFNLCNLQIYTASTNNADIVIRGLNYDQALQYKQLILNKLNTNQNAE